MYHRTCVASDDSDQPARKISLRIPEGWSDSSLFASRIIWHLSGHAVLNENGSNGKDALADLSLFWAHMLVGTLFSHWG